MDNTTAEAANETLVGVVGFSTAIFTMGTIYIIGLIGNLVVLVTFITSNKLRTPQNSFILSLAVADILALSQLPLVMKTMWLGDRFFGDVLCLFSACLTTFSYTASVMSIMMVAVGRYVSIVKLTLKDLIFTWPRCALIQGGIFALCMLAVSPTFTGWIDKAEYNSKMHICGINAGLDLIYDGLMIFFALVIPCSVVLYAYLQIYRTFKRSRNSVKTHAGSGSHRSHSQHNQQRNEIRLAVQLFLIFTIFCFSWMPFTLLVLFDRDSNQPLALYQFSQQLIIANSAVNPPIYFYFNRVYRAEFGRIFRMDRTRLFKAMAPSTTVN